MSAEAIFLGVFVFFAGPPWAFLMVKFGTAGYLRAMKRQHKINPNK